MNFAPFSSHLPAAAAAAAIPTIHQFAAKFGYEGASGGAVVHETRYQSGAATTSGGVQFAVSGAGGAAGGGSGGGALEGVKFRQADSVVVVSSAAPTAGAVAVAGITPIHTVNTGVKYQAISSSVGVSGVSYGGPATFVQANAGDLHAPLKLEQRPAEKREFRDDLHHDIMATMMQQHHVSQTSSSGVSATAGAVQTGAGQQLLVVVHEPKEAAALARAIKQEHRPERPAATAPAEFISIGDVGESAAWQSLGGGVADYLSALPLPLHHLLKYSAAPAHDKRGDDTPAIVAVAANALPTLPASVTGIPANAVSGVVVQTATLVSAAGAALTLPKKKKKKKPPKEKKPRPKPGEIRLTTALDGSTLYCCPECHMAYPERGLLDQHLVGHTMERRFICDICNAALKRKDHLTRHKQSHNPERPHACSVCLKAFKRKEQLTLHFVIHSGEKRHVCNECGKGFYRKDHLRKHTRSHIARRVKAELSQQGAAATGALAHAVPAPAPAPPPPVSPS